MVFYYFENLQRTSQKRKKTGGYREKNRKTQKKKNNENWLLKKTSMNKLQKMEQYKIIIIISYNDKTTRSNDARKIQN